jgi:peptide deformylase
VRGRLPVGAGIYDKVERAEHVRPLSSTLDGAEQSIEADGLLAVCLQHEIDHLEGKVFVEHLSQLKQLAHQGQARQAGENYGMRLIFAGTPEFAAQSP